MEVGGAMVVDGITGEGKGREKPGGKQLFGTSRLGVALHWWKGGR
jgi:hypothetical protein